MFNLFISGNPDCWDLTPYECDKTRFLEMTEGNIQEQFRSLSLESLKKLKTLPCIFAIENEEKPSRIGYIQDLKVRSKHILVEYKFDPILPVLPPGTLDKLSKFLDLDKFERHRTHWAIKDSDLFEVLIKTGYLTQEQSDAALFFRNQYAKKNTTALNTIDSLNNDHVFIVHGQDDETKNDVSMFIKSIGLVPIILHEQASLGKTIIEKIEAYTNVGFAVVLYTPCDLGNKRSNVTSPQSLNPRARQNVVLEHGYLMAKLGRSRVTALVKGTIETPNDISGVVYIDYDSQKTWQQKLVKEITMAGVELKTFL